MVGCGRNLLQMMLDILIGYDSWYECSRKKSQLRLPVIHVLV